MRWSAGVEEENSAAVCFQPLWFFSDEVHLFLKASDLAALWPQTIPDSQSSFVWQRVRGRDTL